MLVLVDIVTSFSMPTAQKQFQESAKSVEWIVLDDTYSVKVFTLGAVGAIAVPSCLFHTTITVIGVSIAGFSSTRVKPLSTIPTTWLSVSDALQSLIMSYIQTNCFHKLGHQNNTVISYTVSLKYRHLPGYYYATPEYKLE